MSQETIERSFEVDSPARLNLGNIHGDIDIQAGEEGILTITAIKHLDSGDAKRTEVSITQEEDGRVTAKTEYTNSVGNWFGIRKPCKVDYKVHLPRNCAVKVSGVSCPISVDGLEGSLDLNTVSGGLSLTNLVGELKISTVSGKIDGKGLQGELTGNCVSGSVRIMDSQLTKAMIKTVSGSLVLQTPLGEGPYSLKGVSGNAVLIVPEDTACSASFHSVSGKMRTSLPITKDGRMGSRGTLEIQGGGVSVAYKCVSGSFKIVSDENETVSEERTAEAPPVANVDRMEMLKKIERGDISVDEALEELNG